MERSPIELSTTRKVTKRLIIFLFICFTISILDRVNIGFAALGMNKALGFSSAVYGFGAGIFFIGYFLLEVPGSAIMTKIGARRWISRIMVSWAIIAACMALVRTPMQFYIVRFCLGVAEASFYPCMVWYLSGFFQTKDHAKAIAGFMIAIPAANAIGAPISSWLLGITALGLSGWQWLFIAEAIPSFFLGIMCWFYLDDKIEDVKWLEKEELAWLIDVTTKERVAKQKEKHLTFLQALKDRDIVVLSATYLFWMIGYYGILMFLPTITKGLSTAISTQALGWIIGLMYVCAMITMYLVGRHSDKTNERRFHAGACLIIAAIAMVASVFVIKVSIVGAFIILTISLCGAFGAYSPFWAIPPSFLTGAAAAAAIAMVNSIGNLGGFIGPYLVGYVKTATGSFNISMFILGASFLIAAFMVSFTIRETGKARNYD